MKKYIFIILLSIVSCKSEKEIIKGEIFIKLIDFVNLHGSSKEDIKSFKEKIIKAENDTELSLDDKKLIKYYKFLITNNLLESPNFKLQIDSQKIITVFTNEKEYLKLNKHLKNLDREKEKVVVEFKGVEKMEGFYFTDNIILAEKTVGKTGWNK
jgi:hypothetical protein